MAQSRLTHIILGALLGSTLLTGCGQKAAYSDVEQLPLTGWSKEHAVSFDFQSTDTASTYDIIADIRSDDHYPYQNFWLFIHSVSPEGIDFSDTLECVLADNYGRWIGKSTGSMFHLPVLFMNEIKFPQIGNYHFDLIQGMREDTLVGIREVGIRIVQHQEE